MGFFDSMGYSFGSPLTLGGSGQPSPQASSSPLLTALSAQTAGTPMQNTAIGKMDPRILQMAKATAQLGQRFGNQQMPQLNTQQQTGPLFGAPVTFSKAPSPGQNTGY